MTPWQKRNAAAQAKGYRNYYDYRIHQYGKRPASEEPPTGEERRRLEGKRGRASLRAALRKPDRIALIVEVPEATPRTGQWDQMRFIVTFTDADIREYLVDWDDVDYWHEEFDDLDIDFVAYASATGE